jgi:hypothetical protein
MTDTGRIVGTRTATEGTKGQNRGTVSPSSSTPCMLCGKVAWYLVGNIGFCGTHKAEAYDAAHRKRVADLGEGRRIDTMRDRPGPMRGKDADRPMYTL